MSVLTRGLWNVRLLFTWCWSSVILFVPLYVAVIGGNMEGHISHIIHTRVNWAIRTFKCSTWQERQQIIYVWAMEKVSILMWSGFDSCAVYDILCYTYLSQETVLWCNVAMSCTNFYSFFVNRKTGVSEHHDDLYATSPCRVYPCHEEGTFYQEFWWDRLYLIPEIGKNS